MEIPFRNESVLELLPYDGLSTYYGNIFTPAEAVHYFAVLEKAVPWRCDIIRMFGKEIVTARKVAWYGDRPFEYDYSGHAHQALPWTAELIEIKNRTEETCKAAFNACLLNLYHHGNEGMGWHSDDEEELEPTAPIASVSFGAPRKFSFKHKSDKTNISVLLENGSLLTMDASSQRHWLHALPKSRKVSAPRINLTFRRMR